MNKESKIYIAGHTWLVWSAVVKRFRSEGCNNLVLRTRKELNLLSQQDVDSFFEQERPEYVILCAAKVWWVAVHANSPFDVLHENLQIQNNVIWAAYKNKVQKLLFVASGTIYPSECIQPISESSLLQGPLDPLHEANGLAKICGIKLCENTKKQSPDKEFFTLVPTNMYGVGDSFEGSNARVIGSLIARFYQAKQDNLKEVVVWGSWNALREFLYVDDMADAIHFFMTHTVSSSFINVGTDQETSIKEIAYTIKEIVWYEWGVVFDTTKPEGRLRRKLDTTLASSHGWDAQTTLKEWLQKTYQYFLSTLDKKI
jgi:GDP-L-fucose synthase